MLSIEVSLACGAQRGGGRCPLLVVTRVEERARAHGGACLGLASDDAVPLASPPGALLHFCLTITTATRHTLLRPRHLTPPSTAMSGSPPPEERAKADADARAKEQAEQAALPYRWEQTIKDVDITIAIDAKYKAKDLDIAIARNSIKAGIRGQDPILHVRRNMSKAAA